jgi:hypothetical protein
LTIEYSPGCLVTCGSSAAAAGPAPMKIKDNGDGTVSMTLAVTVASMTGAESWKDDSEKTNDCD